MSPEEATEEATKGPTQFTLLNIFITKALYEFIGADDFQLADRPPRLNVNVELTAGVKLFSDLRTAIVEIDSKIISDPKWQPYRLEVKIAGTFQTSNGTTEELMHFCKVATPSILFPYIRETAHRLTMDAPGGVVRLDPMNISTLLNQNPWSAPQVIGSAPNAQPQPSEQSPSASPESEP